MLGTCILLGEEGQHACDLAGNNVGFEVDPVAHGECAERRGRRLDLRLADAVLGMEDLPLQIAAVDDIIVTAQKREQNLQDVPIVVTTLSQEALDGAGVRDIKDLQILTPGMTVTSTSSEASTTARIRGVGTVGDNPGLESSVPVFIDGVYRSRSGIGLNELGEIDRVEVLRGPQGTLGGRNSTAGMISIHSKKPSFTFGGSGEATYGNYDFLRIGGSIDVHLRKPFDLDKATTLAGSIRAGQNDREALGGPGLGLAHLGRVGHSPADPVSQIGGRLHHLRVVQSLIDDAIDGDTVDGVPRSFPMKLLALLHARFRGGGMPLTILPCELISRNGEVLQRLVVDLASRHIPDAMFVSWLTDRVIWGNTLVDRIVSEPIEPAGAIAEPYAIWAIERQPGLTLPCEHPCIKLVDEETIAELNERVQAWNEQAQRDMGSLPAVATKADQVAL